MNHAEMDELYELYLMGVLEFEQAAAIAEHLNKNCEYCLGRVRDSSVIIESLAALPELTPPPPHLRDRILAMVAKTQATPSPRPSTTGWRLAFAVAAAAALALLFWGLAQHNRFKHSLLELEEVTEQRNGLRTAVAMLTESNMRTVEFGTPQTEAHGRIFIGGNGGVVFVASQLPTLESGKTFELWLVPGKGNPQPAGLFRSNAQGISVDVLSQKINPTNFAAIAVSIEPDGGSPQPSSKPILVVPLNS